jgi:hypothetical protein
MICRGPTTQSATGSEHRSDPVDPKGHLSRAAARHRCALPTYRGPSPVAAGIVYHMLVVAPASANRQALTVAREA